MNIKTLLSGLFYKLFRLINSFFLKSEKNIVIHSKPDYCDMTRAILNYFSKSAQVNVYILTCETKTKIPLWLTYGNVHIMKKKKIKGNYMYFTYKYGFITIGLL